MTNLELRSAVRGFMGPVFLIVPTVSDIAFVEVPAATLVKVIEAQPWKEPAIWNIQEATSDGLYLSKDPAP